MKTILKLTAISLTFALIVVLSGFSSGDNNAAFIDRDFGCNVFDGNGGLTSVIGANITVVTSSGHTTLVCKAKGLPNDQGKAVIYRGFTCNTYLGPTNDSQNTVSASGNVTLTCTLKD